MTSTRSSKKRDAILQALSGTTSHPSAEWLYQTLKPTIPDLSLGTVYRNLALFLRDQRAIRVATVNGQERFDSRTAPHAHFICRCCGGVTDIEGVDAPPLPDPAMTVEGYQLNYYGVCRNCEEIKSKGEGEKT